MRKNVRFIVGAALLVVSPTVSYAATQVTIMSGGTTTTLTAVSDGKQVLPIQLAPTGGSTRYGNVTISSCTVAQGCSGGPARVYIEDGDTVDKIVLTDTVITANAPSASERRRRSS